MIVPMKKVSLACMKEDRAAVLKALQKAGVLMLTRVEDGVPSGGEASANLRRMDVLLRRLKPYRKKRSLLEGLPEVEEAAFDQAGEEGIPYAGRAEELLAQRDALEKELAGKRAEADALRPWQALSAPLEDFAEGPYAVNAAGSVPARLAPLAEETLRRCGAAWETVGEDPRRTRFAVSCLKEAAEELFSALKDLEWEEAAFPKEQGTAAAVLARLELETAALSAQLSQTEEALRALAEEAETEFSLLYEQYRAANEREETPLGETLETVYLEGWARADRTDRLEAAVCKASGGVYSLALRDPAKGETPPTATKNNRIVSQFENITDMFSSPDYREPDPNPVMAPWYWLIFGLMMGDAGYGLMMAVLILLGKKLLRPSGTVAQLMNVMLYSSVTTMLCGVVFGSYFGETWNPLWFSPMDDPVAMLIFTLVIGVFHIFTGMICKMVQNVKQGRVWDAVFDQAAWMVLILGLGMLFLPALQAVGAALATAGALVVLFTAGREKKGFLGKAAGGLVGLYGITSYLSDILSYSRILALSLATGVVGMVMNMLAGMIQGNPIGWIFSLAIYVVGHVFNLALGLLSAYVHDCRLQYIEFYGKFFEGGGVPFRPFAIRTNQIRIRK